MASTATTRPVNYEARLEKAQRRYLDALDNARADRELRDQVIRQAIDEGGLTTTKVARAVGISQSRVMAILATS